MKHIALLTLACAAALAQPPQLTPEHKKLEYFAGNWTSEAQFKIGPPGSKMSSTAKGEILPGGFFLVIHSKSYGAMGPLQLLEVMGYDPKEKVYTFDEFNSVGEHVVFKGTVEGDTWTWNGEADFGGKMMKARFTMKILSPTAYDFRFDYTPDGEKWVNVMEGKATKN